MASENVTGAGDKDSDNDIRRQLLNSGWRQGSILPPELAALVSPVLGGFESKSADWPVKRMYIVVSQDCDIVQADFRSEPTIEVILATKIPKQKDGYKYLRNPRMLHIGISSGADDKELAAEVRVAYRGFFDHALLLSHQPSQLAVDSKTAELLASFVSRRYLRDARPENFDLRLGDARDEFESLLGDHAENGIIFEILFEIEPDVREPLPDEEYIVKVIGVLKDQYDVIDRSRVLTQMDTLKERIRAILLPCNLLFVDSVEILGRSEISLTQRDRLHSLEIVWPKFASDLYDSEESNAE